MEHTLDATNEKLGRIASKAAALLAGKATVAFARNKMPTEKVKIINASKISFTEKKLKDKEYADYSGYPGGLKHLSVEQMIVRKGYSEIVKRAVVGMLPKNKLRAKMLINLKISE